MGRGPKLKYAQKQCLGLVGRVMQTQGMLSPGARIGVAVSGGVDSFTLLQVLMLRQRIVPFDFELLAIHVNPGFDPHSHAPLEDWVRSRGLAAHFEVTDFGPRAHSPENRKKSPCFYCSMLRRKRFFDLCREYRLTHLALGHTADDLVATFFMNLVKTARVDGLSCRDEYFGGEFELIRPLIGCEKKLVTRAARQWGLPVTRNACPSAGKTERTRVEKLFLDQLLHEKALKRSVFRAITRWQLDET
jgi:tRNA(Ile)-lysidine synthase TilS/MesJ